MFFVDFRQTMDCFRSINHSFIKGDGPLQGTQVYDLIQHQALAWQETSPFTIPLPGPGPYVFSGSGSSYYLAQTAAHFALLLGLDARAQASTDVILEPETMLRGTGCLVIISRSGTTTEALWAASRGKEKGWPVVAVTCHAESPLVKVADFTMVSPQGEDHTIVMIKSFSSMLFLLQNSLLLTVGKSEFLDHFSRVVDEVVQHTMAVIPQVFEPTRPRRLYLLGSGVRFGIAQEGALKAQEMSNQCAMAYVPMEFRHGPWGSVTREDLVVVLGQTRHRSLEHDVVQDLLRRTDKVIGIAQQEWFNANPMHPAIVLPANWSDITLGPLAIIPLQILAWHWTIAVGKDPDHPDNITQVVQLHDRPTHHVSSEKRP